MRAEDFAMPAPVRYRSTASVYDAGGADSGITDPAREIPRAAMSPAAFGGLTVAPLPRRTSDAQCDLFDGCLT
ncbi:hypothetical protein GCM10009654_32680 [Streptomyces hebeiensis]|uniref:Uncharacterized protein n=1 Tax=Streptomyces hebeiensis TaxID=229486 RepID=A0ABP4FEZ2_9ACTN